MDKRFIIFVILAAAILIITPRLFPPPVAPLPAGSTADSALVATSPESSAAASARAVDTPVATTLVPTPPTAAVAESLSAAAVKADTIKVVGSKATYSFSTVGAVPLGVELHGYQALSGPDGPVQMARTGVPLMEYELLRASGDTVRLDRLPFTVDSTTAPGHELPTLTFRTNAGGTAVAISYTFSPDSYLVRVRGKVEVPGAGPRYLLVRLPRGLNSQEADTTDDQRHLAYVVKQTGEDAESAPFNKLDTTEVRTENGPLDWVATKSKYFVLGMLTDSTTGPFSGVVLRGLPYEGKVETNATAVVLEPVGQQGDFAFDVYAGPQEWRRLLALGNDFDHVNPYGGFFQRIVQPFATIVMRILLWTHDHLQINYGWVLVIFGVVVRLILWPLNQSAMRSSLKMQRIQPELQALQKKYKGTPEKQQAEIMKLYKEHGMSPFSPLAGCLPMLIPMPVLFALYFVFQNTIEFRGVSFLWMMDLSLKDPYYILPIVMGISMFVLSWIGLRSSPPNAQAKMMAYFFPVMMTVFFLNLAAGLNLYYAVQNIAALPQQWLIARERAKVGPVSTPPSPATATRTGARTG